MAIKDTITKMEKSLLEMMKDLEKAARGNKAAAQRVRTNSIKFAKLAKTYRKESVKGGKSKSKTKRKTTKKKTAKKKTAKRKTAKKTTRRKTTTKRKAAPKRKATKRKTTKRKTTKRKTTSKAKRR